jgi:chromosomal replication initiation ATPase DnaA
MLRDAIRRSLGITETQAPAPPTPVFAKQPERRGRPKGSRKVRHLDPKIISLMEHTARYFRVSVCALISPDRRVRVVEARRTAMYLVRRTTPASYPEIGFHFGNRDHTTVIHAEREVQKRIAAVDHRTIEALNAIYRKIAA